LIFMSATPRRVVLTLRVDAVVDCSSDTRRQFGETLTAAILRAREMDVSLELAHLVVFDGTGEHGVLPCHRLVAATCDVLDRLGVSIGETMASHGERFWRFGCPDGCCPGLGHRIDTGAAQQAAFAMVTQGCGFVEDRAALEAAVAIDTKHSFDPSRWTDARADHDQRTITASGARRWRRSLEDELVNAIASRCDGVDDIRDPIEMVDSHGPRWALGLADSRIREPVMFRLLAIEPAGRRRRVLACARELLTTLASRCSGREAAPVAATLAAISWQQGDGAFASIAADRALAADATNRLGQLISAAAVSGVPPRTWWEVLNTFGLARLRDGSDLADGGVVARAGVQHG